MAKISMSILGFWCSLLLVFGCTAADVSINTTTLVHVHLVIRHGIRTILSPYPTYPIPVSYWENLGGLGILSYKGVQQMNDVGKFFRNYYGNFLNLTYDASRVYVRSTDYDRTLQSMEALLSGLFPPANSYQQWDPTLNWFPIPVHTMSGSTDTILRYSQSCPRFNYLQQAQRNSSNVLSVENAQKDFVANMSKLSGISPLHLYDTWQIADNARIDIYHNLTLAPWVKENYDKLMYGYDFGWWVDYSNQEMAKLVSGSLLNTVVTNIVNKVKTNSASQLYILGVHDYYLVAIQSLLNISTEIRAPSFGAAYIFELRMDNSSNYFVRILWKNDTFYSPITLYPVSIYGCTEFCPLAKFLNLTADKVLTDFNAACAYPVPSPPNSATSPFKASYLLLVALFFWMQFAKD